jgi:hypothetical protein
MWKEELLMQDPVLFISTLLRKTNEFVMGLEAHSNLVPHTFYN